MNGRGAYLSKRAEVIERAQKTQVLNRQLNAQVDEHIYDELIEK